MEDKTKRQHSILHPLANNNQLPVKTVDTSNTADNNYNNNNSGILSSSYNPQQQHQLQQQKRPIPKNVAYPPMYSFNISTANTLKNSVSTTKATSGLPVAPDGYIYVKGYGSGSAADHIPRNIPNYYPRRGTSITNNYTESSVVTPTPLHIPRPLAPPHLLQPPNLHQLLQQPQPQQHDNGETVAAAASSPTLEIFNTLNPRKAPNMTYKEKIMNWMSSIPQFNDSENNEIYIDCYPGVISTSVTPSTSDEEIDLADIEDILELQARKVTRYVTRLYIRESENWEEIAGDDEAGDVDGGVEYEVEEGDDDDDVDDDDYDEDRVQPHNYVYRNANLNIAYETD